MASLSFSRSSSFVWFTITSRKCIPRTNFGIISLGCPIAIQNKSSNIDVLDIFTKKCLLGQESTKIKTSKDPQTPTDPKPITADNRSQILKKLASQQQNQHETKSHVNIKAWNEYEIDNYITVIIDCNDKKSFHDIFDQIIQLKKLPSNPIILRILCFMCDDSACSMEKISQLVDVCRETNVEFYARSMEFAPFLAQYLWKIDRFDDALTTLNEIFPTSNKSVKSSVLRNYRQIIFDAVRNHDEEIVAKLAKSAKNIFERHRSPVILVYVWADCFYSHLFRNQEQANEIFESYEAIRRIVSLDIGWIVLSLVQQHNVDGLHRLIEQCLKFNMRNECGSCMRALFDYHYSRRDLRSLSEVRRSTLQLNISLSNEQNKKLLQLEKNQPIQQKTQNEIKPSITRFEFKF